MQIDKQTLTEWFHAAAEKFNLSSQQERIGMNDRPIVIEDL